MSVTQQHGRLDTRTTERTQSRAIIGRSHTNTIVELDERTDEDDDDIEDAETVPQLIEGDIAVDQVCRMYRKRNVKTLQIVLKIFVAFV